MADTHSLTPHLKMDIPEGDVFVHAGDFTRCGSVAEVSFGCDSNGWPLPRSESSQPGSPSCRTSTRL